MKNVEIWLSHAKSSAISRVYRCFCNFCRQNPRRFPGFTVVVVIFVVEIIDDFHDFVSECVSFQRKINNPFWVVTVFPKKSDILSLVVKHTTHILPPTKINENNSLRSAPLTVITVLE